ncbi:tetratricopeptide repeat protein [Pararhizobium sp.]|uniref:tetratricopeptide repeat protein n=1 Tax=Pararhizobium sp. TaxID=1977563 RepID=UPI00271590C7|nr:tetratricopeptide repeat protein [Pararhizobium sp.]MDO9415155.1 tetratricopeptide repeat protein [Pararhizobium sp.]
MLNPLDRSLSHLCRLLLVGTSLLFVPLPAHAQDAAGKAVPDAKATTKDKAVADEKVVADEKAVPEVEVPVHKRGRVPTGSKAEDVGAKPLPGADGSSSGVSVLERMGADLPELPAEKPFTGKVDAAYGAYQRGYYLTAMELALPRAQLGDPAAQTLVAEILQQGLGVPLNKKEAAFWYGQGAAGDDPSAMFKYALLLMDGVLVPRDPKKAEELMQKSADRGNSSAQFNYAQALVRKMPGDKGLKAALPYYEKSAEQGIADAQYALSQIYLNVDGIDESKRERAREWLLRAARAGFDTAQFDLAVWLIDGIAGERNLDAGFGWMRRAAEGGNVLAQNKLSHLYVNAIGTRPDPVEAAKWYVLSRRAGLKDPALEDFYLGLNDVQQKAALDAANRYRTS